MWFRSPFLFLNPQRLSRKLELEVRMQKVGEREMDGWSIAGSRVGSGVWLGSNYSLFTISQLLLLSFVYFSMSTASKITFGASCLFAAGSFIFINYSQKVEREALRQGPIKDAARIQAKKTQEFNKKQLANSREHDEQILLRQQLEKIQPLSPEIIRGEDQESK